MIKKTDILWVIFVTLCDVYLWLGFLGALLGLWTPGADDAFSFGRLFFLHLCVMLLNVAGTSALLDFSYPDGGRVFPNGPRISLILCAVVLAVCAVFFRSEAADHWSLLFPGLALSLYWFLLLSLWLYRLRRRRA